MLAALLNPLLGLLRRSWHLSASEVALVYVMALVAASVPSMGLTGFFLPYLSGAQYYATPENGWASQIQPHLPTWLVPESQSAIWELFEGAPRGAATPWDVWLQPLLAWGLFIGSMYLVTVCLLVVLRKQWVERERLTFPIIQLPMAMASEPRSFFRNRLMWMGFAVAGGICLINGLHVLYPSIPQIPIKRRNISHYFTNKPWNAMGGLHIGQE